MRPRNLPDEVAGQRRVEARERRQNGVDLLVFVRGLVPIGRQRRQRIDGLVDAFADDDLLVLPFDLLLVVLYVVLQILPVVDEPFNLLFERANLLQRRNAFLLIEFRQLSVKIRDPLGQLLVRVRQDDDVVFHDFHVRAGLQQFDGLADDGGAVRAVLLGGLQLVGGLAPFDETPQTAEIGGRVVVRREDDAREGTVLRRQAAAEQLHLVERLLVMLLQDVAFFNDHFILFIHKLLLRFDRLREGFALLYQRFDFRMQVVELGQFLRIRVRENVVQFLLQRLHVRRIRVSFRLQLRDLLLQVRDDARRDTVGARLLDADLRVRRLQVLRRLVALFRQFRQFRLQRRQNGDFRGVILCQFGSSGLGNEEVLVDVRLHVAVPFRLVVVPFTVEQAADDRHDLPRQTERRDAGRHHAHDENDQQLRQRQWLDEPHQPEERIDEDDQKDEHDVREEGDLVARRQHLLPVFQHDRQDGEQRREDDSQYQGTYRYVFVVFTHS